MNTNSTNSKTENDDIRTLCDRAIASYRGRRDEEADWLLVRAAMSCSQKTFSNCLVDMLEQQMRRAHESLNRTYIVA